MRKKLYKAKKNWVIGLAAGALLLVGGATTASADANWNPPAAQFSQFGYNSRPTVTWSGIDTSQYPGVTSNDPANINSAVLDANVNVQTAGEDAGLNQTTPGFSYNVTTNGHSLRNDESVNVDYYFSNGVNYGTNGAEFDSTNSSTISYAGTFRNSVEANYLGVSGSINDHQITMRRENDAQMTHTSDPHNVSYLTKEATVNGNTVTNTIRVNTDNGAVQPGVWGLTIKPYWAVNGDVSVYDTAAPYKNGNAFYYIIRDAQGRPQWLEVIRPQNGMRLFSGHDINYTTGPLGGYQMSGNSSTAPGSARNLYMMAPAGLNAEFTYTESYYWVGDGYNNPQANVNAGYLDGYQLEQDNYGNPLLHVAGWHAASTSADLQNGWLIVFDNTTGTEIKRQRINPVARPDVAAQYRNVANSSQAGFDERISLPSSVLGHQLTIIARYSDDANGGEGHRTDLWLGQRININMDNNAHIDGTKLTGGKVVVNGWHATNTALGRRYHYVIAWDATRGQEITRQQVANVSRADVGRAFPTVINADRSGFSASFDLNDPRYANDQIQFISRYTDDWAGNGNCVDYWFAPQRLLADTGNHASLDGYRLTNAGLQVAGWHATNAALGRNYHTIIVLDARNGRELGRQTIYSGSRPDVARAFPGVMNADQSGFNTTIAFNSAMATDPVRVISRWSASRDANSNYVDYWFAPVQLLADQGNYANLDGISWTGRQVQMGGWHASNQAFGKQYHYIILFDQTRGYEVGRQLVESGSYRPDVANAFRGVSNADNSGFNVTITPSVDIRGDRLQVVSRWTDDPAGNGNGTDYWFAPRVVASRPSDADYSLAQLNQRSVTDPAAWGIYATATADARAAAQEWQNGNHDYQIADRMKDGLQVRYNPTPKDSSTILNNQVYVDDSMPAVINEMYSDPQMKLHVNKFTAAILNGIRQALGINNSTVLTNSALIEDAQKYIFNPKISNTQLFGEVADYSDLTGNVGENLTWQNSFGYGGGNYLTGDKPYETTWRTGRNDKPAHSLRLADFKGFIFSMLLTGNGGNTHGFVNGQIDNKHYWGPNDVDLGSAFNIANPEIIFGKVDNPKEYVGLTLANPTVATHGNIMLLLTSSNVGAGIDYN